MARRVGFIGLGRMGSAMAGRLLEAGLELHVYNRSAERCRPLVESGARQAPTPAALAEQVELVISMVADGPALLEVALGPDGLLLNAPAGLIFADMSTVAPGESARVAEACEHHGVAYLRAPVTGSTALAAAGTLGILASGPRGPYEEALEVFRILGQNQFYLGSGEEARVMKLALNMLVHATMAAWSESLVLGEKAGLDWRQMFEVFANSAMGSPFVKYKAGPLAERDFGATFTASLVCKDLDLMLEAARELGVATPITALNRQLYQAVVGNGWGELDTAATILLAERAAGIEDPV